jgi:hypothetical protein
MIILLLIWNEILIVLSALISISANSQVDQAMKQIKKIP